MNVFLRRAAAALVLAVSLSASIARAGDAPAGPTQTPREVDGVILDDGRQIEGTYEEIAGQKWIIRPKGGAAEFTVSVTKIVLAEKGGEVDQKGEDLAAARLWRGPLHAAYFDAVENAYKEYVDASVVDKAKAALDKLRAMKAEPARLKRLAPMVEGKTQNADPAAAEKPDADLAAADAALVEGLVKGSEWCKKRGFVLAATSLATEIGRVDPKKADDAAARAKALMPDAFFFKDKPDAVQQWTVWADALLPSSAEFVTKDDEDAWGRLQNEPWTDGQTLLFRTKNVLLFIRDLDPKVCGKALQLAEGTCRANQIFLHDGEPDVVSDDLGRLEIRIHKSRADYLAEKPKNGRQAEAWTAGYYSPWDNISHFYVDHTSKGANLYELTRVLTHEFTHHYINARWTAQKVRATGTTGMSGGPGFWIVEGMAEFVQNQMHHIDERGFTFDEDACLGNVSTAHARRAGLTTRFLQMETFIDMSQGDFASLKDEPVGGMASERQLWYDQAGALCYFLLQKKGPEMRQRFVRYCADHYAGNANKPGWKFLGYDSAATLDREFNEFLQTLIK